MTHPHLIENAAEAREFMFGGKARFTLVSKNTGKRYTYRVSKAKDADMFFASLLTGQSNEMDYTYIGFFPKEGADRLVAGRKGNPEHPAFKALDWAARQFANGRDTSALEFWHEGRCARCARVLTDPASIERGLGPECATKI